MVFQKSNPFPKSVYENVVYGLRIQGIKSKSVLDEACEKSLRNAALWDEVKSPAGLRSRPFGRSDAAHLHRARSRSSPRSC